MVAFGVPSATSNPVPVEAVEVTKSKTRGWPAAGVKSIEPSVPPVPETQVAPVRLKLATVPLELTAKNPVMLLLASKEMTPIIDVA